MFVFFFHQLCQSNQYIIGGAPGDEEMWIDTDGTPYAYYEKSSLAVHGDFLDTKSSTELPESQFTE